MSEPKEPSASDPMDDKAVASLYARGSAEQPSKALDRAILEKAREATGSRSTQRRFIFSWQRAVTATASLLLGALVGTIIHEEVPHIPWSTRPAAVIDQDDSSASPALSYEARPYIGLAEQQKAKIPSAQYGETAKAPKAMTSGITRQDLATLSPDETDCTRLTEQECLASAACTLSKDETTRGYQCQHPKDHCAMSFSQSKGTRESCEASTGCEYVPASCFCPPGVVCQCAGGEPAHCRSHP